MSTLSERMSDLDSAWRNGRRAGRVQGFLAGVLAGLVLGTLFLDIIIKLHGGPR